MGGQRSKGDKTKKWQRSVYYRGSCLREAKGQRELMKIDCKRTESSLTN
jgi:hypothetical protein